MQSNKLLPLLSAVVILMVLFIGLKSCGGENSAEPTALTGLPETPKPDADSPADTIRTLTATVSEIKNQNEQLIKENDDLKKQRNKLKDEIKAEVRREIDRHPSGYDKFMEKLDSLRGKVEALDRKAAKPESSDIPLGLGIRSEDAAAVRPPPAIVWTEPMDIRLGKDGQIKSTSLLNPVSTSLPAPTPDLTPEENTDPEPVYTIPRNATLVGSTGMTALIGRLPFNGQVQDPFPFKILIAKDNLAANGLEIPGVYGMVFSGEAFGDWALSCVRGKIKSVTYVFDDGTIRTLSSDDNSLSQLNNLASQGGTNKRRRNTQNQNQGQNRDLGWISDRRGIPCVTGERISNATDFLAGRILARAAEAAATGLAQNETTRQVSPLTGVNTNTVTGDTAKFAGLSALSGGASEISDYLKERAAQSFDVVYVDTGAEVAVHLDRELPIDYDPLGRKLAYANTHTHTTTPDLD